MLELTSRPMHSQVLSGALASDADFSNTKLVETVLTKVTAEGQPLPACTQTEQGSMSAGTH